MIKVTNYSKRITNDEIELCLSILPDDVAELDMSLIFPRSAFQCLRWVFRKNFITLIPDIFRRAIGGSSSEYYSICYVYPFNYNLQYHIERIQLHAAIFHEIRHQYQRQVLTERYLDEKCRDVPYEQSFAEVDAHEFTNEMMHILHNAEGYI